MNKTPADRVEEKDARRVAPPVNALTAFLRHECEGRYNQSTLAKAAGFSRDTANRLLNDDGPVLAALPSAKTLQGLARAFPEVGIDRITDIARKAVAREQSAQPLTLQDLARARFSDLKEEVRRREESAKYANRLRERMARELQLAWSNISYIALLGALDPRRLEVFGPDLSRKIRKHWGDPDAHTEDGTRELREAARAAGPEVEAAYEEFTTRMGLGARFALQAQGRSERFRDLQAPVDPDEVDPLPVSRYEEEVAELRGKFDYKELLRRDGGSSIHVDHDLVESAIMGRKRDKAAAPADELAARRKKTPPETGFPIEIDTFGSVPYAEETLFDLRPPPLREEPGWAARDYPEWAQKPGSEEGFDGGV